MRLCLCAAVLAALFVSAPSVRAHAPAGEPAGTVPCAHDPSWSVAQKPFRVHGNTWHVGPRGLGVFLVTSPAGHVLIDGGIPASATLIEDNIRSLGFDLRDVRWIVVSHAHCDHAGGVAQLARDTGARVIAGAGDAPLLARGGRDDPQYGNRFPFPAVRVAAKATDGYRLRVGDLVLSAHATPGHTQGNTSWTWQSCAADRCLDVAFVGSLSGPGYRLVGNPRYPDAVRDFERSFAVVAALPCDVALAPHPEMVDFWERVERREQGVPDALVDPGLCREYAQEARAALREAVAQERKAATRRP
ncbi:MAG: subclass B3 metallo-beta-lactamase [Burkholderiales bacterium]